MKTLLLVSVVSIAAVAQVPQMPKIMMIGTQSERCQDAALKALYIERQVGVVPGHQINVYCTREAYVQAIAQQHVSFDQAPDGVSLLKTRVTFLNAESILRIDGDRRHRGDFLIAHEIGHFAMDSSLEWQADAWASDALKKYVPISYEDFRSREKIKIQH